MTYPKDNETHAPPVSYARMHQQLLDMLGVPDHASAAGKIGMLIGLTAMDSPLLIRARRLAYEAGYDVPQDGTSPVPLGPLVACLVDSLERTKNESAGRLQELVNHAKRLLPYYAEVDLRRYEDLRREIDVGDTGMTHEQCVEWLKHVRKVIGTGVPATTTELATHAQPDEAASPDALPGLPAEPEQDDVHGGPADAS